LDARPPLALHASPTRRSSDLRERDGQPRLHGELEEPPRGIDLADRLAQAGGRDLDRDPALDEALDGRLVIAAQVALGHRRVRPPDRKSTRLNSSHDQTSYAVL